MKKQLLSVLAAVTALASVAQTPSPSWTINQNAGFTVAISGINFLDAVDANVVWAAGLDGNNTAIDYNWISRTINGGTTWNVNNAYGNDTTTYQMANMEGIDANTCWVSAFLSAIQGGGAIHRTTNGGTTWTDMTPTFMYTNTASFANIVSFFTPSVGITMGDPVNGEYEIYRTTDGGATWAPTPGSVIPNPIAGEFGIVDLYAKEGTTNLWFGTQRGRIYRTFDAGLTWSVGVVAANTFTVTELEFSSQMNGMCFGVNTNGLEVYNTTNGGATWTQIAQDPNMGRNDLGKIPGTNYIASVDNQNQMISYSSDNGLTFTSWGSTGLPYLKVDFVNSSVGWAGAFSAFPTATIGGVWKYSGTTFNSQFTLPQYVCKPIGDATITPVNTSSANIMPLTFTWTANNGATFSSANASVPVISFPANGIYTVILAAGNSQGVSTSSQVVTVLTCSTPVAGFNSPASACNNVVMTLTNTSVGVPVPAYVVTTNPATNVTITPGSGALYSLRFGTPGTYTITMVATNVAGTNTTTQVVTINNCAPVVSFSIPNMFFPTKCFDPEDPNRFMNTTNLTTGAVSYTWSASPAGGVQFAPVTTNSAPSVAFASTATGVYTITLRATNVSGTAAATQTITVDLLCTSVKENSLLESNLDVFPNPAKDVLNINLPISSDSYQIKLTNILGSVVFEEKSITNKEVISINLYGKPKGVYFLTVFANNEKVTKKIIIE